MKQPDWYPDWRHEAVHQLQEKNARLAAQFRISDWPRYDYDLDAGTLVFSDEGVARVIAEIQIAGTTSAHGGDWLWAWANADWPRERAADAERARAFGAENGIHELVRETVAGEDLNAPGWALTAVMARITDALGAYRPRREEGGGLYLVYRSIAWAN